MRHRAARMLLAAHVPLLPALAVATDQSTSLALIATAVIASLTFLASWPALSRRAASTVVTFGLMASAAFVVQLAEGATEAHFHFFIMVAVLALYEDWAPYLVAFGFVILHHGAMSQLPEENVFGHGHHLWFRALLHSAAIIALGVVNVIVWRINESLRESARAATYRARQSEELFRRAFEDAATGMALISPDGRLMRVNRAYRQITGYSREDLIGRKTTTFTHPEDRAETDEALRKLAEGEAEATTVVKRYVRPGGEEVWAEVTASVAHDDEGEPLHIISQVQDVTVRKRTADALRASESRYRTLVDHLPDAIVAAYDLDFRCTFLGGSIFDKLGWDADRIHGKTLHEALPSDVADAWAARFRAAMAGMPNELEYESETGLDLNIKVVPVHDENGDVTGVMTVSQDVTDRRRADEALRESQERLQAILDYAPAVIYLKDSDGRFILANHGLEDLLGVPFEQIRGRTDHDFFPAEVADVLVEQDREVRDTGRPLAREFAIEVAGEQRTYFDIKFPIFDTGGDAAGVCAIATDITARKRAEIGLRVSEQRHRSVVDALEEGVLLHDLAGRVIACNNSAARMIGLPVDEIVGKTPGELPMRLVDETGHELAIDEWPAFHTIQTGEPQLGFVAGHPTPDGGIAWLSINCNPIVDPQTGKPFAVAASFADITEQRLAERLKEEFFALVSHELRTPLTSITGYLELVLDPDESELDPQQVHFLGVVERNARRLQRLVGDLLFVAQFEGGKLALDTSPTQLQDVAAEAVESARPQADELGIELRLNAEAVPPCMGDAGRLGQALDNLISNAVKFTPAGGRVDVRVLDRRDRIAIEVADTGLGISHVDQSRLFERFFRTTSATENAIPGVGLGLSIAKAIVEGHGGRISVASQEGRGTTFTIEMPVQGGDALTRIPPMTARTA